MTSIDLHPSLLRQALNVSLAQKKREKNKFLEKYHNSHPIVTELEKEIGWLTSAIPTIAETPSAKK